jgi:glycerol-3-phosphate acyltransferase PlsX
MTTRIAVDAMGGDQAPHEVVAGALMAAGTLGAELILVGQTDAIRHELRGVGEVPGLRIVAAEDVIEMEEHPTEAVRAKPGASLNVGLELVKHGEADAFVTAGNTGATMAAALLRLGRVRGIARPALGLVYSSIDGRETIIIDVGANADCRPIHLVQFAYMAAAYMERMFGVRRPRVALLSIGEEDSKGDQLAIEVNTALHASRLNFVGNVEGKDLLRAPADVIVTDGFTGNVVLKTVEGIVETLFLEVRKAVELTPWNRAAGLILQSELRKVRRQLDYTEYGGAQLLGVDGVTVIAHGRSNARAVFSAIRAARDAVERGVLEVVREVAAEIPAKRGPGGEGDDVRGDESAE